MRQVWLTLLLAFALVAGGVASASAGVVCPMQAPAAAAHDCCPDDEGAPGTGGGGEKMANCPFALVCRTASVAAPDGPPAKLDAPAIATRNPPPAVATPAHAAVDGPFRPPRTL